MLGSMLFGKWMHRRSPRYGAARERGVRFALAVIGGPLGGMLAGVLFCVVLDMVLDLTPATPPFSFLVPMFWRCVVGALLGGLSMGAMQLRCSRRQVGV